MSSDTVIAVAKANNGPAKVYCPDAPELASQYTRNAATGTWNEEM
ncbi:MAG TPA: hypothetical protein PK733_02925 [Clostridiales bacterium]|nr:hypothetical protein [Clostridiales bacterium]